MVRGCHHGIFDCVRNKLKTIDEGDMQEIKSSNRIEVATDSGGSMLADAIAFRPKAEAVRDFTPAHELVEKLLVKILGQMGIQRPEDTAKEWIEECRK